MGDRDARTRAAPAALARDSTPEDHRGSAGGGFAAPEGHAAIADGGSHRRSVGRALNRGRHSERLAPPDPHRPPEV